MSRRATGTALALIAMVAVLMMVYFADLRWSRWVEPRPVSDTSTATHVLWAIDGVAPPRDPTAARHYSEGLQRLRRLDPMAARNHLWAASRIEPDHALTYAALSEAWGLLGFDDKAVQAATTAREVGKNLSGVARRVIEGRYHQSQRQWSRAIEAYRSLFDAHPGDLDYGLWLASAQISSGDSQNASTLLEELRQLPGAESEDPRIDLREARARLLLGDAQASRRLAEQALAKGRSIREPIVVASARVSEALALQEQGDAASKAVFDALDEAHTIYQTSDHLRGVAETLQLTAYSTQFQGDLKGAQRLLNESLAIYRQIHDQRNTAAVLLELGNLEIYLGQLDHAEALLEESLVLSQQADDRNSAVQTYVSLGVNAFYQGDLDTALARYQDALALAETLADIEGVALAQSNIAEIHLLHHEFIIARRTYTEVLAFYRQLDDRPGIAYNLFQLGQIAAASGDVFVARDRFQEALTIQSESGQTMATETTRLALAELILSQGDAVLAEKLALQAEEVFLIEDALHLAGQADALLVRALVAQGKLRAARAIFIQAHQIAADSADPQLSFAMDIAGAYLLAASDADDVAAALDILLSVVDRATEAGFPSTEFAARRAIREIEASAASPRV